MVGLLRKIFWGILGILLIFLGVFRLKMDPVLQKLAAENAQAAAFRLITQAVNRKISEGEISYGSIISFEKDYEGRITALKTNMQQVNDLKTRVLGDINSRILLLDREKIGVPLGDLMLPAIFGGRGPRIPVSVLSVRRSGAEFISHFTQAGINQTLHRLTLRIQVEGAILVLGKIRNFSASGIVLVAETVIVGQVPHTFS